MAVLEQHFYNKTINTYTSIFGSVFNDIKISRANGKMINVPISYSLKQKYDVRNTENKEPNAARYKMILPRLGFQLVGVSPDPIRRTNKMNRLVQNVNRSTAPSVSAQYNRNPYVFQYQLFIKTKNIDELWQIVEQILFYFNPTIRVRAKDNESLDENSIITIKLTNSGVDTIVEGSFEDTEVFEVTMDFELEGWLYGPVQDAKPIYTININYFDMNTGEQIDSDQIKADPEDIP